MIKFRRTARHGRVSGDSQRARPEVNFHDFSPYLSSGASRRVGEKLFGSPRSNTLTRSIITLGRGATASRSHSMHVWRSRYCHQYCTYMYIYIPLGTIATFRLTFFYLFFLILDPIQLCQFRCTYYS